jgi:hypothetical protein
MDLEQPAWQALGNHSCGTKTEKTSNRSHIRWEITVEKRLFTSEAVDVPVRVTVCSIRSSFPGKRHQRLSAANKRFEEERKTIFIISPSSHFLAYEALITFSCRLDTLACIRFASRKPDTIARVIVKEPS